MMLSKIFDCKEFNETMSRLELKSWSTTNSMPFPTVHHA